MPRDVSDKRARPQRYGALLIEFSCADKERTLEHRDETVVVVKVRHAPRVRAELQDVRVEARLGGITWLLSDQRTTKRSSYRRDPSLALSSTLQFPAFSAVTV